MAELFAVAIGFVLLFGFLRFVRWLFLSTIRILSDIGLLPDFRCTACGAKKALPFGSCPECAFPANTQRGDLAAAIRAVRRLQARQGDNPALQSALEALRDEQRQFLDANRPLSPVPAQAMPSVLRPPSPTVPIRPVAAADNTPIAIAAQPVAPMEPAMPVSVPAPPPVPTAPRRSFADVLQSFMLDKNIQWVELVAGMLIVVSSFGLVLSLWATLKETIPYFPAFLFIGLTAAVHGAGMYTLRHWKLEATSRGLLSIGVLLAPLNFTTIVVLSQSYPATNPYTIACGGLGIAVFGWIVWQAGNVLAAGLAGPLLVAVVAGSATQLVIGRLADPTAAVERLYLLACLPLTCFLAAGGWLAAKTRNLQETLTEPRTHRRLLFVLGTALFAFVLASGVLVHLAAPLDQFEERRMAAAAFVLGNLSPILSIAGIVPLALGLLLQRKLNERTLAAERVMWTSVSVAGACALLLAIALSWPDPALLVTVGLMNFIILTVAAIAFGVAEFHMPALACFALAAVTGLHLWQGAFADIPRSQLSARFVQQFLAGRSGLLLFTMAALCAGGAAAWSLRKRLADARSYLISSGSLGLIGLAIAGYAGFWSGVDLELATLVFAAGAAAATIANVRLLSPIVGWFAAALSLVAAGHALAWNQWVLAQLQDAGMAIDRPLVIALLVHGTLGTLIAWLTNPRQPELIGGPRRFGALVVPFSYSALAASAIALPWTVNPVPGLGAAAALVFWTALLWLLLASMHKWTALYESFQCLATLGLAYTTAAAVEQRDWVIRPNWLEPRHLHAQLTVLFGWSLVWVLVRKWSAGRAGLEFLSRNVDASLRRQPGEATTRPAVTFDQLLRGLLVVSFVGLCLASCIPGVSAELSIPLTSNASLSAGPVPGWVAIHLMILIAVGVLLRSAVEGYREWTSWLSGFVILGMIGFAAGAVRWDAIWQPIHYAEAHGPGAWIVLVVGMLALSASLWERIAAPAAVGLAVLGSAVPALIAAHGEPQLATATMLRWGLAGYVLFGSICCWQSERIRSLWKGRARLLPNGEGDDRHFPDSQRDGDTGPLISAARQEPRPPLMEIESPLAAVRAYLLLLGVAGTLLFSLAFLSETSPYSLPPGPSATSVWSHVPLGLSHAIPLAVVSLCFAGFSVREQRPALAFTGGLILNAAVSLGYVLTMHVNRVTAFNQVFTELWQWNTLAFAFNALVWLAGRAWLLRATPERERPIESARSWLGAQLTLAIAGNALWAGLAILVIIVSPGAVPDPLVHFGSAVGAASLLATAAATGWFWRRRIVTDAPRWIAAFGMAFVGLFAAAAAQASSRDDWRSYHLLTGGWTFFAFGLAAAVFAFRELQIQPWMTAFRNWTRTSLVLGLLVAGLAVRGIGDPQELWPVGLAAAVMLLTIGLALIEHRQLYAYLSVGLAMLGTTLAWIGPWSASAAWLPSAEWATLVQSNLVAIALLSCFWLWIELRAVRHRRQSFDPSAGFPPVHHAGALAVLVGLGVLVGFDLGSIWMGFQSPLAGSASLSWIAWSLVTLLLLGSLTDPRAAHVFGCGYGALLIAGLMFIARFEPSSRELPCTVAMWLGIHSLLVSMLWQLRDRMKAPADRWMRLAPAVTQARTLDWLSVTHVCLALVASAIAFWASLAVEPAEWRWLATGAVACSTLAIGLLAKGSNRRWLYVATLLLATAAGIDAGWSAMPITNDPHDPLHRAIRLLLVLSAASCLFGLATHRLFRRFADRESWAQAHATVGIATGVFATAILGIVLIQEAMWYEPGTGAPVAARQIVFVAVALLGLAATAIAFAVRPQPDPFGLSRVGRRLYVYAAEALLTLLFVHIRLTVPELFSGMLSQYWPMIVMPIAFAGLGLGELLARWHQDVLSEPLQRTAAFLPLLPVLGFWVHASRAPYSSVLFAAGLVYASASYLRGSFAAGLLAALAGNAALWAIWLDQGRMLAESPQLWLIPPALSVLAAAHLNRGRLTAAQLSSLRYLCVAVIYVSSTAEMFIHGAGENFWLPVILASLSIAGVFAGILLQVQSFLYVGSTFLFVSLVSMVHHAYRHIGHVWPWWAFGITMGVAILTTIGVFEKRRNDVLDVAESIRQWQH